MYNNNGNKKNKDILIRIEAIENHLKGYLTEKEVSNILAITERQVRRLIKNYKEKGKLSLLQHGLSNKLLECI
jgi:transposase